MRATDTRLRPIDLSDPLASLQSWNRTAYGAAIILTAAGIFACLCDTPMIWDGAYQFCFSLIRQQPYFYLTRFHSYILWLPVVLLSHVTTNLTVLKLTYGLPFALAPAASVLLSWWIVRLRAPRLIIWAIFGTAAALPGQIFIINDSIFQQHMFWPVFLGLLVPLNRRQAVVVSLLAIFQLSHQIGLVLLTGAAATAALFSIGATARRKELLTKSAIALFLAVIALWKILHFPDSYAQREFTWERVHEAWRWGVEGYPLRGLYFMWAAGAAMLLRRLLSAPRWDGHRLAIGSAAGCCVIAAAIIWTIWAIDSHKWCTAVNYRRWVVPLTVPFYVFALLDARFISCRRSVVLSENGPAWPLNLVIGCGVAAVFALVLSVQSIVWVRLTRHLQHDVESYPRTIVPWSQIAWTHDTALYHWSTTAYVFVLESRQPRRLLLDPDSANAVAQLAMVHSDPPSIPLSWFTPMPPTPGPAGWFDFRPMLERIDR